MDEDTNHVSHHIETSSNDDAVIYPYTPQQIVFNSDDEENRELEEGEISEMQLRKIFRILSGLRNDGEINLTN